MGYSALSDGSFLSQYKILQNKPENGCLFGISKEPPTEMAIFKPWIEKSYLLTVTLAEQVLKHLKDRDLGPE